MESRTVRGPLETRGKHAATLLTPNGTKMTPLSDTPYRLLVIQSKANAVMAPSRNQIRIDEF